MQGVCESEGMGFPLYFRMYEENRWVWMLAREFGPAKSGVEHPKKIVIMYFEKS